MANAHPSTRFQIGQKFIAGGRAKRLYTVTDIYSTYNQRGSLVKIAYVATHEFMGQTITDCDVCETTIAKGEVK